MFKFNDFVAKMTAKVLSSMWLFWLLVVVLIILWIMDPPRDGFEIALFVISTAFQAIALPVLAFVSNQQGDKAAKVAKETLSSVKTDIAMANETLAGVRKELKMLQQQQEEIKKLLAYHKKEAK